MDVVLMGRYVHLGWFRHPKREDREKAEAALKRIGRYQSFPADRGKGYL